MPFDRLGDFRLLRPLGHGGMGAVYEAEQVTLGRLVALKVIRSDLRDSPPALRRFEREARSLARLRHESVVTIHGFGEDGDVCFIAMELVPGRGLDEILEEARALGRRIATARIVRWCAEIARALDVCHRERIVHRDVKPTNIRIREDDRAVLVDFGLVRDDLATRATFEGSFAGSPFYASPEQVAGVENIDGRSDVFSLGVTLYESLTGRVPFESESVEALFHRILTLDPRAPRKLDPSIPRDLDVVTMHALEKDRDVRYGSAAELAEDLEAILEFRPIRARPPSLARRSGKWIRRQPAAAASLGTLIVALVAFIGLVVHNRLDRIAQRKETARSLAEEARESLDEYREVWSSSVRLEKEVDELRRLLAFRHLDDEEYAKLDGSEIDIAEARRQREAAFYNILALLRQARESDPNVAGLEEVRAGLYVEKLRESLAALDRSARDEVAVRFYRELVSESDPSGGLLEEVLPTRRTLLESNPPGAEVWGFRYEDGSRLAHLREPRIVPVPMGGGDPEVPPGSHVLRVVAAAGDLRIGDHIVEVAGWPVHDSIIVSDVSAAQKRENSVSGAAIQRFDRLVSVDGRPIRDLWELEHRGRGAPDTGAVEPTGSSGTERAFEFEREGRRFVVRAGSFAALGIEALDAAGLARRGGCRARAVSNGVSRDVTLPPGLDVRPTAVPLATSPACRLGVTPVEVEFEAGEYLLVYRLDGYDEARQGIRTEYARSDYAMRLVKSGRAPPGFVRVMHSQAPGSEPFWFSETEITARQYLEFLNDPETLAAIEGSTTPIRFPRSVKNEEEGGYWPRGADGRFRIPEDWKPNWPVIGVSYDDAVAYAGWRTRQAHKAGRAWTFTLPEFYDYLRAATDLFERPFPYGWSYRARWSNTCFSREVPGVEPVLSYPVDESPSGVYDVCGSVFEWLDAWSEDSEGKRRAVGGSWAQGAIETQKIWSGIALRPDDVSGEVGIRLLARVGGKPSAQDRRRDVKR